MHLKDPVCGMEVKSDNFMIDYLGIRYVFCSAQCLERFQSNPHLYIGYPGSEAPKHTGNEILKNRTLRLSGSLLAEVKKIVIESIQSMMGVHYVAIEGNRIEITYDLLQATEEQIEKSITAAGAVPGNNLIDRIKRAFVQSMEETEVISLEARPANRCGHKH
ncbi:MAG: YHS domain-containing protein [Gammaproteobacteria bacterium]|nr:YHS domain-containing protein [Gammaproteobacteria bacterium]